MRGLVREQRALQRQSAAVAREAAVRADHAVARHDERYRIRVVRRANAARALRLSDRARDLAVAARLAVRDRKQRVPHRALKLRAVRRELEIELGALARAVLVHLPAHFVDRALVADRRAVDSLRALRAQVETDEPAALVDPGGESRERRLDRAPAVRRRSALRSRIHAASLKLAQR